MVDRHQFTLKVDGNDYPCGYPRVILGNRPEFRLRSFVCEHTRTGGGVDRLLRSDGLVNFR